MKRTLLSFGLFLGIALPFQAHAFEVGVGGLLTKSGDRIVLTGTQESREAELEKVLQNYFELKDKNIEHTPDVEKLSLILQMVQDNSVPLSSNVLYQIYMQNYLLWSLVQNPKAKTVIDNAEIRISAADYKKAAEDILQAVAVRMNLRDEYKRLKSSTQHLVPDAEGRPTVVDNSAPSFTTKSGKKLFVYKTTEERQKKVTEAVTKLAESKGLDYGKATGLQKIDLMQELVKEQSKAPDLNVLGQIYEDAYQIWVFTHDSKLLAEEGNEELRQHAREYQTATKSVLQAVAVQLDLPDSYSDLKDEEVDTLPFIADTVGPQLIKGIGEAFGSVVEQAIEALAEGLNEKSN